LRRPVSHLAEGVEYAGSRNAADGARHAGVLRWFEGYSPCYQRPQIPNHWMNRHSPSVHYGVIERAAAHAINGAEQKA
jgi:hypothetical protein